MFLETKRCVTPFHIFVLSLPLVAKKLHKGANTQIKPIKVLLERQNTWLKCNDLAFKNSCHVLKKKKKKLMTRPDGKNSDTHYCVLFI